MNANELADELDSISYDCTIEEWRASPVGNAAAMLRQQQAEYYSLLVNHDKLYVKVIEQQAEIEALKGEIDDLMKRIIDLRPYKQKIEAMEKAYDAHFKKAQQP